MSLVCGTLYFISYLYFPFNIVPHAFHVEIAFFNYLLFLEQYVFCLPCSTQRHFENVFLLQIHFTLF